MQIWIFSIIYSSLQSHMIKFWFGAQETFIIIIIISVQNSLFVWIIFFQDSLMIESLQESLEQNLLETELFLL